MSPITLSEGDREALKWMGEQYACQVDQLAFILGPSAQRAPLTIPATRSAVGRWAEGGPSCTGSASSPGHPGPG